MNKGISLHIGVNKLSTKWYSREATLCSPENDARAMAGLAEHEGYDLIQILLNEEATKENFSQLFLSCARALNSGDTFLLTFSGHGGQQDDENGDEMDCKDETWCFYDAPLLDDNIGTMWKEFKAGVRIIVVSASCHSRSALKPFSTGLFFWQMRDAAKSKLKPVVYIYPDDPQIQASIVHLSACGDQQQARDGEYFSRFTQLLLKTWDNGKFEGSYEELIRSINREAGYLQTSGIALMGSTAADLLTSKPFKLLTNKT